MQLLFKYIFVPMMLITTLACTTMDRKADTPEGAFAIAEEFDKDERYEEAIRRYTDVKNKFPYSSLATKAELAIADVYFKQESFPEAQVSYQAFKELHPTSPQSDYVVYKIGMSYFKQLPSSLDRDLTVARETVNTFDDLMKRYPNSQYINEAAENKLATLKMLAGKEEYIASFYFKREKYESALGRYETLLSKYPKLGFDEKALYGAAYSAQKLGDTFKTKKYYTELLEKYPASDEAKNAQKDIKI